MKSFFYDFGNERKIIIVTISKRYFESFRSFRILSKRYFEMNVRYFDKISKRYFESLLRGDPKYRILSNQLINIEGSPKIKYTI